MWFKNLQIYRLPSGWSLSAGALEEKLSARPLQPCTGLNLQSRGWVPASEDGQWVYAQGRQMLVAMGIEQKLLPGAVVRQAAEERAQQYERLKGFKPGRKMMREIKDQVTAELLPRAFVRQRTLRAWLDPVGGWAVVDASSPGRAEELIELLRDTLGEFAAVPVDAEQAPSAALTAWLASGNPPGRFTLDDECELCGTDVSKPTVRYVRHALEGEEGLRRHIADGKFATRVALTWNERLSLVVTEKLQVKKLKFLVVREGDDQTAQNPQEQFDLDFALMSGELGEMLKDLGQALRFKAE
ncbi:MAG TPA: recombination-associated protein RdgC [Solimonas sp.]|jgi:recombination associated protein RdgC|nr:recombination-associated protein RdgC [Solimonas sp.]